jgi:hypothetical protein
MDLLAYKLVGMLWQKEAALTSVLKDTSKRRFQRDTSPQPTTRMEPPTSSKIATAGIAKRRESGARAGQLSACLPRGRAMARSSTHDSHTRCMMPTTNAAPAPLA